MPFAKGQSGNPGGRPKGEADVRAAAGKLSVEAVKTLAEIMQNKRYAPAARALAADKLLDRAVGKARQAIVGEDGGKIVVELVKFAADEPDSAP